MMRNTFASPRVFQLRANQKPNGNPPPAPTAKINSQISGPSNQKRRCSRAISLSMRSFARAKERMLKEMAREQRRFWFDGPEIWLLIFAVGAGGGLPFGFWLARNWNTLGDAKVFLIIVVMLAVMLAAVGLGGSAWAWLRKSR